jgi:replicative DNA helicase
MYTTDADVGALALLIQRFGEDPVKLDALCSEDFRPESLQQRIFNRIKEVVAEYGSVDIQLLGTYCKNKWEHNHSNGNGKNGDKKENFVETDMWTYLLWLSTDVVPGTASMFTYYVDAIKKGRRKVLTMKELQYAIDNMNGAGDEPIVDNLMHNLKRIYSGNGEYDFHAELYNALEMAQEQSKSGAEMPTGFTSFDNAWGEFWRKELHVLGGDSGHLKTTLSLNLIFKPLEMGKKVVWFDREMSKPRLLSYIAAIRAGVEVWRFRKRMIRDVDVEKMAKEMAEIQDWKLRICDDVTEPAKMNEIIYKNEPDITVIDNFQNMDFPKSENFWAAIEGSKMVKDMALDHNTAVLLLTQVTRSKDEVRLAKPPTIEQLFGTRGLKHNADVATIVHWKWKDLSSTGQLGKSDEERDRVERMKNVFDVYHAKMRGEAVSADHMYVDAVHGRFANSAPAYAEQTEPF